MTQPLISCEGLKDLIQQEKELHVFDCRFDLAKPEAGLLAWQQGHIPRAQYAHLDQHLSGPKTGQNGRHPLPTPESWKAQREQWGLELDMPIVCYDDQGGIFAARLWWMLKSAGHTQVMVLDGGFSLWKRMGGSISTDAPTPIQATQLDMASYAGLITKEEVKGNLEQKTFTLVDARAPDRFAGQNETLDPVGGHIPGALNHFYKANLQEDGTFKSPALLQSAFNALGSHEKVVHQCGSGVTACHNLLAMEVAGLTGSRLYAGSWSEWCCQEGYPIASNTSWQ